MKGFKKSETKTVVFKLTSNDMSFYHQDLKYFAEPGEILVFVSGSSDASLSEKLELK